MEAKPFWQSKTLWFNVASAVIKLAESLTGQNIIPDEYLLTITLIGNIILRYLTTGEIKLK